MKQLLIILISTMMVVQLHAQTQFRLGLTGSLNNAALFSDLPFVETDDFGSHRHLGSLPSNTYGIEGALKISKLVGFSLSINKTSVLHLTNNTYPDKRLKVSYVEIPLLFELSTRGRIGFYFENGFQYSQLLNGNDKINLDTISYDKGHFYNKAFLSYVAGFGLNIKAGEKILIRGGIKAAASLTQTTQNDFSDYTTDYKDYSSLHLCRYGFQIGVFYRFAEVVPISIPAE